MLYIDGFEGTCHTMPSIGKFTVGKTYHFKEHQLNDIVFIICRDDNNETCSFYEWSGFNKYFKINNN